MTTLVAQLSDPHVRVGPDDMGSATALAAAVAAVGRLDPPPDAVLVTGDVAETGGAREYERARELLSPLRAPLHLLAGNHDDRDALRACFGPGGEGLYRYAAPCGGVRLIACDTTVPGRDDGSLDDERRAWLAAELAAQPSAPAVVAMHHAPLLTGIPAIDAIGLPAPDRRALSDLLAGAPHVRRVVAGHIHRTAFDVLGGCAVVACASTNLALRLRLAPGDFDFAREPPAILLHVMAGDDVVTHVQPVDSC
jgi:3',5'-cyclic-AMP phosphodiesterase